MYEPKRPERGYYPPQVPYHSYEYSGLIKPPNNYNYYNWPGQPPQTPSKVLRLILSTLIIVFVVISIIILMVALNSNWYNFSTDFEYYWEIENYDLSFSFSGVEFETNDESDKKSWDEAEDLNLANTKQVYETTQKLVIIGIIMNIILLIGGIVLLLNKLKIIAVLFSILALIITISAPLYFGTMHPQAMDEDSKYPESIGPWDSFKGSNNNGGDFYFQQSWGPVDGFYYVIYGFFFLLVCFGIALVVKVPWIKSKSFSITPYNQYSSSDCYSPRQQQYPPQQPV